MRATDKLITALRHQYGDDPKQAWLLTTNGRSALELALASLEGSGDDEVIVQAFTCSTAVAPILWAGMKPVFVDINARKLSLLLLDLKKKITPKTKVIIVQHTFGIPGPIDEVVKLANEHNIVVIEDCAHALGLKLPDGRPLGTIGDAAIISFGVDKMLPTVFGGALVVNNPALLPAVERRYVRLPIVDGAESRRWLAYPGLRRRLNRLPTPIGSRLRGLLVRTNVMRLAISPAEYRGQHGPTPLAKLDDLHAGKIYPHFELLDGIIKHRAAIGKIYHSILEPSDAVLVSYESEPLIRYPVICGSHELREHLLEHLVKYGISPITWYDPALFPAGTDYRIFGYDPDAHGVAKSIASIIIALPTGPDIDPDYATMIANELIAATTHFKG